MSIRSPLHRPLGAACLAAALGIASLPASAQIVSDAIRLGAFSGAMQFCQEQYEGPERRYRWARLRAAKEVSDMDGEDKGKALFARDRAYKRGQFLGNRLDARECDALLKMSEWKRFLR